MTDYTKTEPKDAYKLQSNKITEDDEINYYIRGVEMDYNIWKINNMNWFSGEPIVKEVLDKLNKLSKKKYCKQIKDDKGTEHTIIQVPKAYQRRIMRNVIMKKTYPEIVEITQNYLDKDYYESDDKNRKLTLWCLIYRTIRCDAKAICDDNELVVKLFGERPNDD
jgi:hypothetical protein